MRGRFFYAVTCWHIATITTDKLLSSYSLVTNFTVKSPVFFAHELLKSRATTALTVQQQSVLFQLPELFTTAQGIEIAASQGMKERAFKEFLSKHTGTLFQKDRHGEYRKV